MYCSQFLRVWWRACRGDCMWDRRREDCSGHVSHLPECCPLNRTRTPAGRPARAEAPPRPKTKGAMVSPDPAERMAAFEARGGAAGPRWFGEPLAEQMTETDMGFTVPVLLRALRQAMYAQDVFEIPGCFRNTPSSQATKKALRQRLVDGEDPYAVCKPTVPVELLTSMLMDWLYDLPGGLWGQDLPPKRPSVSRPIIEGTLPLSPGPPHQSPRGSPRSSKETVQELAMPPRNDVDTFTPLSPHKSSRASPRSSKEMLAELAMSPRKLFDTVVEPYEKIRTTDSKGNTEILRLMEKTLCEKAVEGIDRVTRVTPLLKAIEPRRREVRAKRQKQRVLDHSQTTQVHLTCPSRPGVALAARDAGPGDRVQTFVEDGLRRVRCGNFAHTAPGVGAHSTSHDTLVFFTQVFEPYLIPGPGMARPFSPHAFNKIKFAEKLLLSSRAQQHVWL